jgi:hypothetical protein
MKKRLPIAFLLLGLLVITAIAQSDADLDRLDAKVNEHLERKMPGWKHKRGEPMEGSKNVLIEFWSTSTRAVKVSVVPYASAQAAEGVLKGFLKYESQKEELKGYGDEAYGWGYGASRVVFRRGRFIVYVSTYAEVDSDPDARSLSQSEKGEREKSEMRRLNREFAKHILTAIDLP